MMHREINREHMHASMQNEMYVRGIYSHEDNDSSSTDAPSIWWLFSLSRSVCSLFRNRKVERVSALASENKKQNWKAKKIWLCREDSQFPPINEMHATCTYVAESNCYEEQEY